MGRALLRRKYCLIAHSVLSITNQQGLSTVENFLWSCWELNPNRRLSAPSQLAYKITANEAKI